MKQKWIVCIYLIVLSLTAIFQLSYPEKETAIAAETTMIPEEAIRLRILANSDSSEDQHLKQMVRDAVNIQITKWVESLTSIEDARDVIQANLSELEAIAQQIVASEGKDQAVHIVFDKVLFPTKLYGQYIYPAGEYEAVVITLGEGKGANWWCVLFPPLCFLDISNGESLGPGFGEMNDVESPAVESEQEEKVVDKKTKAPLYVEEEPVKVTFFLKDLFSKLF
ncbi:stage II sporulation protein R [Bacillus chungangensis]|uniref:Stage II sporulation protein R n=1 Tax=Bacillus chungangensis TaxID=587633 RepID=A0ABT9WWP0_9BACI|nr:stage II sporulation protein R [Bacillus chungangensis]MDQ0177544.1 stage II sporulation protein R [Bacillus chungangensis]